MTRSTLAVLAVALSGAAYVAGQPPAREGLVGTWKLNPDQSDDFREKMRQAQGGEGRPPAGRPEGGGPGGPAGGMGGRGGGMGGRGGTRGEPGSGGPSAGGHESMRRLAEPSEFLAIGVEGDAVLVGDDTGAIRRLYPDGRTMKTDNGEGQIRSRWEDGKLVAATVPARGPRYKETFSLSPDRRQLFVSVHLEPPSGRTVDVRRVYDAAP